MLSFLNIVYVLKLTLKHSCVPLRHRPRGSAKARKRGQNCIKDPEMHKKIELPKESYTFQYGYTTNSFEDKI